MTIATHTTKDGFTLRVFSSMYIDWGLEIKDPQGCLLYTSDAADE